MSTHPEAVKAAERARERADHKRAMQAFIRDCLESGIQFIEFRPLNLFNRESKQARMTLAFREVRNSVVEIATAICHPNDNFCKVTGRFIAGQNLVEGQYILLRRPRYHKTNRQWLEEQFRTVVGFEDDRH